MVELGKRYRVVGRVGQGSVGEVYEAIQANLARPVAVKVMRQDLPVTEFGWAVERFHHEACVTANLAHPNVVTLFDYGCTTDGRPFMAMELLHGPSLQQLMEAGPIDIQQTQAVFSSVLNGIERAHDSGLIHRDLKPGNIMVGLGVAPEQDVKILDFGMSVYKDKAGCGPQQWVVGSLGYMAPEQARAEALDHRADLYAVGVMVYQALTGAHPFEATSVKEWLRAHMVSEVPLEPFASSALKEWFRIALAKNPEERFESAGVMKAEMERALRAESRRHRSILGSFHQVYSTVLAAYTVGLWTYLLVLN